MFFSRILGHRCRTALIFAAALSFALGASTSAHAQAAGKPKTPPPPTPVNPAPPPSTTPESATNSLRAWEGLNVEAVDFVGVDRIRLEPLPAELPVQAGKPLIADDVRQSLRRLYATGLYRGIEVEGTRNGNQVTIIFKGTATLFSGAHYGGGSEERPARQPASTRDATESRHAIQRCKAYPGQRGSQGDASR